MTRVSVWVAIIKFVVHVQLLELYRVLNKFDIVRMGRLSRIMNFTTRLGQLRATVSLMFVRDQTGTRGELVESLPLGLVQWCGCNVPWKRAEYQRSAWTNDQQALPCSRQGLPTHHHLRHPLYQEYNVLPPMRCSTMLLHACCLIEYSTRRFIRDTLAEFQYSTHSSPRCNLRYLHCTRSGAASLALFHYVLSPHSRDEMLQMMPQKEEGKCLLYFYLGESHPLRYSRLKLTPKSFLGETRRNF